MTSSCSRSSSGARWRRAALLAAGLVVACAACASASKTTGAAPASAPTGEQGTTAPAGGSATPAPVRNPGPAPAPEGTATGGAEDTGGTEAAGAQDATSPRDGPPAPPSAQGGSSAGLVLASPASAPNAATASPPTPAPTPAPAPGVATAPRTQGASHGLLSLSLRADRAATDAGGVVTVSVQAASTARIVDAPLHLLYDPSRLRYAGASEGDYLNRDGSGTVFLVNGASRPGDVVIGLGRSDRARGITGSGTLCSVRFTVIGSGTTRVFVGDAMAWGEDGAQIVVSGSSVDISIP